MKSNISRIKIDAACPTKFFLRYISPTLGGPGGIDKPNYPKPAAEFGTAAHRVLEHVLRGDELKCAIIDAQEYLQAKSMLMRGVGEHEAAARVLHGTGGEPYPCKGCQGTGKTLKTHKPHVPCSGTGQFKPSAVEGVEYLSKMMHAYYAYYPEDRIDYTEDIFIEEPLEMELPNGHTLVGRVDLVRRWNDRLWVWDNKTCAAQTSFGNETVKYEMDWQKIAYCELVKAKMGETPAGFIVNFLRKTKVPSFYRAPVPYEPIPHKRAMRFFEGKIKRMEWLKIRRERTIIDDLEQRTTACISYGSPCMYLPICQGQVNMNREELENNGYVAREADYVDE